MTRKQLFPKVDKDVRRLMDETSTRQIKYISIIVVVFETLTLALFMLTRKNFGQEEWLSFYSVLSCILSSLIVHLCTRHILKNQATNHIQVAFLNVAYYLVMSVWSMWSSYFRYQNGEQIITFYAVEIMLVCFIAVKPWVGIVLNLLVYSFVYTVLYQIDHAAGISTINYSILALVSIIGMVVRYHTLKGISEATIQLEKTKNSEIEDKIKILRAIANIYDRVNLIDFENCTEMPVGAKEEIQYELDLSVRTYTVMTSNIRQYIMPDQLDDFIRYTDISTVRERLLHKRLISEDFIDVKDGWFRAQYIPVEVDENGVPTKVVFTTRNVDDEKKREEWLVRIAMTDELTRLYNRRCYDEDLKQYKEQGMEEDFAILSADVNGLKNVNDTLGHVAGDELIRAAAECLLLAVGSNGKVYRTGGDEFLAILHTDDAERICQNIESAAKMWQGKYAKELSVSTGYAAVKDHKGLDIHEIEKLADQKMYQAKAEYYQNKTK
ncbi:MAG: GGDEF domain-containing protein [Lachnospiraceae bacterium]|nr:GGDEF domain-containing protein [Lachnospiraceae bacterium]